MFYFSNRSRAFTLIELLIVVAIIAILAAIAVPNFLEAQTRAKIARVKADLRTIDTGLQSYNIDSNQFVWSNINSWALCLGVTGTNMKPTLERLTSPIAYLNGGSFNDPFRGKKQKFGPQLGKEEDIPVPPGGGTANQIYRYIARGPVNTVIWDQQDNTGQKATWFMLESCGPDGFYHRMGNALNSDDTPNRRRFFYNNVIYDATNGTVSNGSVWRAGGKGGRGDFFADVVQSTY